MPEAQGSRKIRSTLNTIASKRLVLIGGGTGFIGHRLANALILAGYTVASVSRMPGPSRMTWHDLEQNGLPDKTYAVVNLAGQNVLDPSRRWTPGFKQNVWSSRINTTTTLAQAIARSERKPSVFVTLSGVSIYPADGETYTEESPPVLPYDYMSKLCKRWEEAANLPETIDTRQVKIRCGVVLGREGGMIASMLPPFRLGLGGRIGSGSQPLPWIHADDVVGMIRFAIESPHVDRVILNAVAPQIITNAEFTRAFARALRRPAFFPMPELAVNAIFGKERGVMLLTGPKVKPATTIRLGYHFKYTNIADACAEVVQKRRTS